MNLKKMQNYLHELESELRVRVNCTGNDNAIK